MRGRRDGKRIAFYAPFATICQGMGFYAKMAPKIVHQAFLRLLILHVIFICQKNWVLCKNGPKKATICPPAAGFVLYILGFSTLDSTSQMSSLQVKKIFATPSASNPACNFPSRQKNYMRDQKPKEQQNSKFNYRPIKQEAGSKQNGPFRAGPNICQKAPLFGPKGHEGTKERLQETPFFFQKKTSD